MLTEQVIASLLEKTIVGGAFIYLLYYFVNKNTRSMETIASHLQHVSDTLLKIDLRFERLEERIKDLEKKEEYHEH